MLELVQNNPTLFWVGLGVSFLSLSASLVGTFTFLRKRALVGDAVAHAILPGVAGAFLFSGTKDPVILMLGALISGWVAILAMEYLGKHTKLSPDTAIALVLSVFFGIGIVMLTYIQQGENGQQAGLDQFLFGKAAAMSRQDALVYSGIAFIISLLLMALYKELKLYSFNPDFAQSAGLPTRFLKNLLSSLTVLAIASGIQAVGVVLMAALLISPAAAARAWTERLKVLLGLAALFALLSAWAGTYLSYLSPSMPTGPWIVMFLSFFALGSLFFAPQRGLLYRLLRQSRHRQKIADENLLKAFYQIAESLNDTDSYYPTEKLLEKRDFGPNELESGLKRLRRKNLLLSRGNMYRLSQLGRVRAQRVVRLHRLWEMYLSRRMGLQSDHIHPNAETMEHIITPELETLLEKELDFPAKDPHQSPIPYE